MTLKDLTDAVAPKLSQEDEIFALGLADAATEFFGEEVGSFVKGEGIFSTKTAEIVLGALRSGLIGQTDVLSPEAVQSVIESTSNILSLVRGSASESTKVEQELTEAINNLDDSERALLDNIVQELTQRSIARVMDRLATVERVA